MGLCHMGLLDNLFNVPNVNVIKERAPNVNPENPEASKGGFKPAEQISGGANIGNMKRVVDEEAGVVLYAIKERNTYALTAVPIEDTELGLDEESVENLSNQGPEQEKK